MEWSIHEVARLTGTTSRTLRHYDDIGLLAPSRVGSNGYRHYDDAALVRLQRILLLRELGVGLSRIAEVLERRTDPAEALRVHLDWLRREQERTAQQIASVEATIASLEGGEQIMAEKMFDGFDHTRYRDEVEQRRADAGALMGGLDVEVVEPAGGRARVTHRHALDLGDPGLGTGRVVGHALSQPAAYVVVGVRRRRHRRRAAGEQVDEGQCVGVVLVGRPQDQLGLRDRRLRGAVSGHRG